MTKNRLQNVIARSNKDIENAKFVIFQCHKSLKSSVELGDVNKAYKFRQKTIIGSLKSLERDIDTIEKDLGICNKTKLSKWLASFGVQKEEKKEFNALKLLKKTARTLRSEMDKLERLQQKSAKLSKSN
ncbi:MAG: hypothetical protein HRU36_05730 [Rickettsiales bacterium]|nr:hypothetical protein [Rickettsiales bacterium]